MPTPQQGLMQLLEVFMEQVQALEEFLRRHAEYATQAAIRAYQEAGRLHERVKQLETQLVYTEVRACETQLNALREHQNAWAILLLCCKSGVAVTGMERLTQARCQKQILELQVQVQGVLARAQVQADRLGMMAQTCLDEKTGRVQVRLNVREQQAGEERSSHHVA